MTAGISSKGQPGLKKTSNAAAASSGNVRVVGRIRPMAKYEKEKGSKEYVTSMNSLVNDLSGDGGRENQEWTITTEPELIEAKTGPSTGDNNRDKRWFELDAVFDKNSTQEEVYIRSGAAKAVREDIFKGYNATILAYGQTGAGKTFTMGTAGGASDDGAGIIPRACHDLYETIREKCDGNAKVELSYLEIYNEEIHDLLIEGKESVRNQHNSKLKIRETLNSEVYVSGLISQAVSSPSDIGRLMEEASSRRIVGATAMNAVSSRSHAICTLRVSGVLNEGDEKFSSKLTLVDLAGSERIKKTGAQGSRQKEGISINKGLFVLGQVVSALAEAGASSGSKGKKGHHHTMKPPYRDSKLTRLLQDSLGGNSRTIMVACVSPADFNIDESINTLRYATSARNIKNSATRNIVKSISPEEAAQLRRENQLLKNQVSELQQTINSLMLQSAAPSRVASFASTDVDEEDVSVITTPTTIATSTCADSNISDPVAEGGSNSSDKEENSKENTDIKAIEKETDDGESSPPENVGHDDSNDKKRIKELENEVTELKIKLKGAQKDLLISAKKTAVQLPQMKMEIEMMKEQLADKEEVDLENEILRMELEDAKADAKSANIAASKLSDVLDQLRELQENEITKKKKDLKFMKKEEAWVMFVDTLLEKRQEQMMSLSDDFDLVLKVLDSPAVLKNHEKRNWWGKNTGEMEEIYSPELRQKVLREHVDFFKQQMDQMTQDIRVESYSMKQMRESIQSDCKSLENEIGDEKHISDKLSKGNEGNRKDMLSKLAKMLSVSALPTENSSSGGSSNNNGGEIGITG